MEFPETRVIDPGGADVGRGRKEGEFEHGRLPAAIRVIRTFLSRKDRGDTTQKVLAGSVVLAAALGLCQAWTARHLMNIDGISYVDIAGAYARGDWDAAVSAYWNPLYTWMLAVTFRLLNPSPQWEFPVAHFLTYVVYLGVIACFHAFLREFIRYDRQRHLRDEGEASRGGPLPTPVWIALGYTAFIYSAIETVGVFVVSPDLCVTGLIYLAAALLLRLYTRGPAVRRYFLLGACLGAAYLAKVATALPVVVSFFIASLAVPSARRGLSLRVGAFAIGLLLVAGPWVAVLSHRQGHFTISEAGRLNYAWFVNLIPSDHWLGEIPGSGQPANPHKKVFEKPAAYAYDPPVRGTLPGWYDPVHWNEGVQSRFDLRRQLYVIYMNMQELARALFGGALLAMFTGVVALYLLHKEWGVIARNLASVWMLLLPVLATFTMYLLVHLESRFLGATVTFLVLALIAGVSVRDRVDASTLTALAGAVLGVTLTPVVVNTVFQAYQFGMDPPVQWQVADHLRRAGIEPGERVAAIGHTNRSGWARLARVQITAEIPQSSDRDYRTASDTVKTEALDTLFRTGVKAIVADQEQGSGCRSGWQAIGSTGFYVCGASR